MGTHTYDLLMQRCLFIANKGLGSTYPNPLVGALVVYEGEIIGEGFHHKAGEPHAEVLAIKSVADQSKLSKSTLAVNLEPCNHLGKTPRCTDLILNSGIKKVVVGTADPNPIVNGKGIQRLHNHGVDVITGVEKEACTKINKRFFCFMNKKRPYIILKWAQSKDGFMAPEKKFRTSKTPFWLSDQISRRLVHEWRYQENATLVGAQTIIDDNPALTCRHCPKPPREEVRIVIDPELRVPKTAQIYDQKTLTFVLTTRSKTNNSSKVQHLKFEDSPIEIEEMMTRLYHENIHSIIVEGGPKTLGYFLEFSCWDEARIFTSPTMLKTGLLAPKIGSNYRQIKSEKSGRDFLEILYRSD